MVACLFAGSASCERRLRVENSDAEKELKMNWEGFIMCLNHIKPIAKDITELYGFVVNQEYANAVMKAIDIVQKGGEAARVCYNAYKDL